MVKNFKIAPGKQTDPLADGYGAYDGLHPPGADNAGTGGAALKKLDAELEDGRIAVHQNKRHTPQSFKRKGRGAWREKLPAKLRGEAQLPAKCLAVRDNGKKAVIRKGKEGGIQFLRHIFSGNDDIIFSTQKSGQKLRLLHLLKNQSKLRIFVRKFSELTGQVVLRKDRERAKAQYLLTPVAIGSQMPCGGSGLGVLHPTPSPAS